MVKVSQRERNIHNRKAFPLFFYGYAKTASRLLCLTTATKSLFGLSKTDRCNPVGVRNDNMTLRFCGFVVFPQNSFSRSLFICFIVLWKCFALFWKNCSDSRMVVLIREELFWFGRCCFELPRRPAQNQDIRMEKEWCRERFVAEGKGGAMKTGGIGNIFPRDGRILKGRNKTR